MHAVIRNYVICLYLSFSFSQLCTQSCDRLDFKVRLDHPYMSGLECQRLAFLLEGPWREEGRVLLVPSRSGDSPKNVHEILRNHNFKKG